jgi:hypothetical protein
MKGSIQVKNHSRPALHPPPFFYSHLLAVQLTLLSIKPLSLTQTSYQLPITHSNLLSTTYHSLKPLIYYLSVIQRSLINSLSFTQAHCQTIIIQRSLINCISFTQVGFAPCVTTCIFFNITD